MKIKKLVINYFWITYCLYLIPSNSWADGQTCNGPTNVIQVSAKQDSEFPPIYSYVIKNLDITAVTVFSLVLGVSDHVEMYQLEDYIPNVFVSPKGWEGGISFVDESALMMIYWKNKKTAVIEPGQSIAGFQIKLPHPMVKKGEAFLINGQPATPTDFLNVPYNVLFKTKTCEWGIAREQEK